MAQSQLYPAIDHVEMGLPKPERVVVQTRDAVKRFLLETIKMSSLDYDTDEVMNSIVVSLQYFPDIERQKMNFAARYRSISSGDGPILEQAWLNLHAHVLQQYMMLALWDERGMSYYHYDSLHINDLVLCKMPF